MTEPDRGRQMSARVSDGVRRPVVTGWIRGGQVMLGDREVLRRSKAHTQQSEAGGAAAQTDCSGFKMEEVHQGRPVKDMCSCILKSCQWVVSSLEQKILVMNGQFSPSIIRGRAFQVHSVSVHAELRRGH